MPSATGCSCDKPGCTARSQPVPGHATSKAPFHSTGTNNRRKRSTVKTSRIDTVLLTNAMSSAFLQNKMHINDWSAIQTLFDRLNKQLEKIMKTAPGLGVPRVYARILVSCPSNLIFYQDVMRQDWCVPAISCCCSSTLCI